MGKIIEEITSSFEKYLIVLLLFLKTNAEKKYNFLFKKENEDNINVEEFRFYFFFYTAISLYATRILFIKFHTLILPIEKYSYLQDIIIGLKGNKIVMMVIVAFIILNSLVVYFVSSDNEERLLIKNFSTYIFTSQLLSIILIFIWVSLMELDFIQKIVKNFDQGGVVNFILGVLFSLTNFLILSYIYKVAVESPKKVINIAFSFNEISEKTSTKLSLSTYLPWIVSIIIFLFISFRHYIF